MRIQQVNLYQDSLKPKPPSLFLYLLGLGTLIILLLFVGISLYSIKTLHHHEELVNQARAQLSTTQAQVKTLEAKIPKAEVDSTLATELNQWQQNLAELKQALDVLTKTNLQATAGFAAYFQALAHQADKEIWLTAISFDTEAGLIKFEGSTFKADKIPDFLQHLQQEPVFQGRSFAKLLVEESKQTPKLLNFKLSSHAEAVKKNDVQ